MSSYLIEPKAPLLFRDGRPFGASELAETLPFPLPSTVAGALRAAYGERCSLNFADVKDELLKLEAHGPLLAGLGIVGGEPSLYFPKPADAIYYKEGEGLIAAHLVPGAVLPNEKEGTDLPEGLHPLFLNYESNEKPAKGAAFWTLANTAAWLANASDAPIPADTIGVDALPTEIRTHVGIDGNRLTNRDGAVFQTAGLDFGPRQNPKEERGWESQSFGLLARFRQPGSEETLLADGCFRTVGGEGRLASIKPCAAWPEIPDTLDKALANTRWLKLLFVTPALFDGGWRPAWLDGKPPIDSPPGLAGLKLRLCAAALERWQPFSGWELRTPDGRRGGAARAVRRLVPAGSVYWFEVLEGDAETLRKLWLAPLSDRPQDRLDGFGLAIPGIWSGELPN